jgi:hypothetical protein
MRTLPSVWIATAIVFGVFLYCQYLAFDVNSDVIRGLHDGADLLAAGQEIRWNLEAYVFNAGIVLPVLGAVIGGSEFRAGQIGMSVIAVPRRATIVVAKFVVGFAFALSLSLIWMACAVIVMSFAIGGEAFAALWDSAFLAGQSRILLFLLAFTLFPLGLALIMRRALACIVVAQLLIMLTMTQVIALVSPVVDAFLPLSAARNLLLQGAGNPVPLTGSAGGGALVLVGWVAALFIGATIAIVRRDAR